MNIKRRIKVLQISQVANTSRKKMLSISQLISSFLQLFKNQLMRIMLIDLTLS